MAGSPAAILGTFTDIKFVRVGNIWRISIDVPEGSLQSIIEALGEPKSHESNWVGVARVDIDAVKRNTPRPISADKKPSQIAALLCVQDAAWRSWIVHKAGVITDGPIEPEEAAQALRQILNIKSRSELDTNSALAGQFQAIVAQFGRRKK